MATLVIETKFQYKAAPSPTTYNCDVFGVSLPLSDRSGTGEKHWWLINAVTYLLSASSTPSQARVLLFHRNAAKTNDQQSSICRRKALWIIKCSVLHTSETDKALTDSCMESRLDILLSSSVLCSGTSSYKLLLPHRYVWTIVPVFKVALVFFYGSVKEKKRLRLWSWFKEIWISQMWFFLGKLIPSTVPL